MRKQLIRVLASVSVWLVVTSVATQAQAIKKMTVRVPFDFNVRDKQYPAGTYAVLQEGSFLSLRNNRGRVLTVLTANSVLIPTVPKQSKLVFFESHGVHLLTRAIWEGNSIGSEFVGESQEEEVARRLLPTGVTSAQVGGK